MPDLASSSFLSMPSAINIAAYPVDWICLGTIFVLLMLFALWNGTARIASLSLALGIAVATFSSLPDAVFVGPIATGASVGVQAGIFAAIVAILYILMSRILGTEYGASSLPLNAASIAFGTTLLLAVVWVDVSALSSLWQFGPQVKGLLAKEYQLWEMLVAYAAIAFARS